jgi:hypothetical protein
MQSNSMKTLEIILNSIFRQGGVTPYPPGGFYPLTPFGGLFKKKPVLQTFRGDKSPLSEKND